MLCNVCANIDLDEVFSPEGYHHHASLTDLCNSAYDGCDFCMLIQKATYHKEHRTYSYDQDMKGAQIFLAVDPFYSTQEELYHIRFFQRESTAHETGIDTLCYIALFTEESPAAEFIPGRLIGMDTSSDKCMDQWRNWHSDCLKNHAICASDMPNSLPLPTRVIDVGPSDASREPCLFISEGQRAPWTTLSYCWGDVQPPATTLSTLEANVASLPLAELPPLFRDAVLITRSLGCRYLWIDSLCILQDSPEDWANESAAMGNIYKNSFLTIAADAATDCRTGIFESANRERSSNYSLSVPIRWTTRDLQAVVFPRLRDFDNDDFNGPLNARGWVLQEEMLSPRTLRFATTAVRWECRTGHKTEEYPISAESDGRSPYEDRYLKTLCLPDINLSLYKSANTTISDDAISPLALWYRVLSEYSKRKLTYFGDNLPAIAGLAREVERHLGYTYLAGIWKEDLCDGLLWYSGYMYGDGKRSEKNTAPSWSWASVDIGSGYKSVCRDGTYIDETFLPEVQEIEVINGGPDAFGQVLGGHLTITAPVAYMNHGYPTNSMPVLPRPFYCNATHCSSDGVDTEPLDNPCLGRLLCFHDTAEGDEEGQGPSFDEFAIYVQISSRKFRLRQLGLEMDKRSYVTFISALILEPTHDAEDTYRRAGLASIPAEVSEGWETRTITII